MKSILPRAYSTLSDSDKNRIAEIAQAQAEDIAKPLAKQIADKMIKDSAANIIELCVMIAIAVLITEFSFGTDDSKIKGREMRISRFIRAFWQTAGEYVTSYDEATYDALKLHLQTLGVCWERNRKETNNAKSEL